MFLSFDEFLCESDTEVESQVEVYYEPEGSVSSILSKSFYNVPIEEWAYGAQGNQGPYGPQGSWVYDYHPSEIGTLEIFNEYMSVNFFPAIAPIIISVDDKIDKDGAIVFSVATRYVRDLMAMFEKLQDFYVEHYDKKPISEIRVYYKKWMDKQKGHPKRGRVLSRLLGL